MKHATVRQLKVFEAVARLESQSRAAEELHLSQPAVSAQIAKLEDYAGLPLFEQLGRRIYLTPAGADLLHHARLIIQQFDEAEAALTQHKGVAGGKLNVAVISAGDYFFPRILVEFARLHAGVTLGLSVHSRDDLLTQLASNQTDLAIMGRPPNEADTLSEAFAPHPYVIVASPHHPLAGERRIPMARLLKEKFIVRETGSDTWQSMSEAFGRRMERLNISMRIKSTETVKQAVMADMGVSFLSAHTVSRELGSGHLALLDVQGFPLQLNWFIVRRRTKRLPPVAEAFRQFLLSEGARLVEEIVPLDGRAPQTFSATGRRASPGIRR